LNNLLTALIAKRIVATVSALLVIAIGCGAGIWQLSRAQTKMTLAANLLARQQMPILNANAGNWTLEEAAERRMIARGQFIPEAAIWLDNRPRPIPPAGSSNTQAGFYLMMPMRLEGRNEVLWINRGWAPLTSGVDRHYAYAFQWFALAFAGFVFWLLTGLRQYKRQGFANGDQG
jgi:surfeit locus 1 family protein